MPQLEDTPEMPPSSRGEGLLFLPGLESNHESSLKREEEGKIFTLKEGVAPDVFLFGGNPV